MENYESHETLPSQLGQTAKEETQLESCRERAGQINTAASRILSRLEALRGKLEGSDRPDTGTEPTPVPRGLIDEIGHVQSASCKSLDLVSMELDSLERMI